MLPDPGYEESSFAGVSQRIGDELARLPGFKECRKMLDLGGAHGMDCIAALQKNPDMQGIVFDKPAVARTTRGIILEYGLEDRMTVLAGDYITDPIGSRYDLIHYDR